MPVWESESERDTKAQKTWYAPSIRLAQPSQLQTAIFVHSASGEGREQDGEAGVDRWIESDGGKQVTD